MFLQNVIIIDYSWLDMFFASSLLWNRVCVWHIFTVVLVLKYNHVKLENSYFGVPIRYLPKLAKSKLNYKSYWIECCWLFYKCLLVNNNSDLGYRSYWIRDFLIKMPEMASHNFLIYSVLDSKAIEIE